MIRSFLFLTMCFALFVNLSFAQEICNNNLDDDGDGLVDCLDGECGSKVCEVCDNGVDDDGDGFIDCYDKECSRNGSCDQFFLGQEDCAVRPEFFAPVQLKLKYKSDTRLTNHVSQLRIGDVDSDGIPEIVTAYRDASTATASTLNVLQASSVGSSTLAVDKSINIFANGDKANFDDIAMADIDKDGCAEVFVLTTTTTDATGYKIIAYNVCTGTRIWAAPISFTFYPGNFGLADFNGDGEVELYCRTAIYNAHTGAFLGENNIDNDNTGINAGVNKGRAMNSNAPIAVDVHPTPGLELIAGCRIYAVAINKAAQTATLSLVRQRPEYGTRTGRTTGSGTSVADFNQDGTLDVIAVGSFNGYDLTTTIFFWDLKTDALKTYTDVSGTGDYTNGWKNGAGRINIADIDGDTLLNAVYVSGKYLYALKEGATNLEVLWREQIIEETSGYTGCTVFDLNGDGKSEIIYRDEDYLRVYSTAVNGVPSQIPPIRCASRTMSEYPVVADMDGDGTTEICITCSTIENTSGKNQDLYADAEVRVYESANEPWLPARKVWNQHGYFNVNVNDDLTIPRVQQLHHLIYAKNAPCRKNGTTRPLNAFMNQGAYLNASGCPMYPRPDFAIMPVNSSKLVDYTPFTCAADSFQVKFKFRNQGVVTSGFPIQVSFYNGDPQQSLPLATRLATKSVEASNMHPGDTITATVNLKNPGAAFDLYIVVNDDGTTLPLDISQQHNHISECSYENITSVHIEPNFVPLGVDVISNNLTCVSAPGVPMKPNNGVLQAYASFGGAHDNTSFNFYWSIGPTPKPIASIDYIGSTFTALPAGVYTVYAKHKNTSCATDTVSVVVNEVSSSVDAKIVLEHEFDDAENPNGALRVVVNDTDNDGTGDPENDFDYAWYSGIEILAEDTLSTSSSINQLGAGTYSVLVFDSATGCYDSASAKIQLKQTNPSICPSKADFAMVRFNPEKYLDYPSFNCAADSFQVTFKFRNQGGITFNNTLRISFYNGDPRAISELATRIETKSVFVSNMNAGDTVTTTVKLKNQGTAFDLYIVINDNGTTLPLDFTQQPDRVAECDYDNVAYSLIKPESVSLVSELIQDDLVCETVAGVPTKPHNGSAKAYISLDALKDNTNFNFYWSIGTIAKSVAFADFTGHTIDGLPSDNYTVYALHKDLNCASDTATVVVGEATSSVDAKIVLMHELDDAENPNGALKVIVNDTNNDGAGDPENNFGYAWYSNKEILVGNILATTPAIDGLSAGTYSVLVQDKATGCYDSAYATLHLKKNILSTEEGADITGVSLYPNPGTDGLTVVIDNAYVGNVQIQLQSALGNEVYRSFPSHKGTGILTVPVDVNKLKSGVYLVKVSLGKGTAYQKWVKK